MKQRVLDSHIVSYLLRGAKAVLERVAAVPMSSLCISAITRGELLFGLARRLDAQRLHQLVHELLIRLDVLPWDRQAADSYGSLRAQMQSRGLWPRWIC